MTALRIVNAMFARGLGGIEQAFLDYNEALRLAGHEVHAIVHPGAKVRARLEQQAVSVHTLANLGAWDPWAAFRLKRLLRGIAPHLAIAHGNRALSLLKRAMPALGLVAPAHNYKIQLQGVGVFAPTLDLMRHARQQGALPQGIFYVPNLVRIPPQPERPAWRSPPVIGAMGRMVAKKGFDVFLEALALMRARGVRFRAVLAGDGEEAGALKALVKARGLEDVVSLPGWVVDASAFFAGIDVFCLPSLHEPFGIVLLEAMAHGLPVAATDSEGPLEILRDGRDGVLVPKGDAAALADAFQHLLEDPARAALYGRHALLTVQQRYTLPVVAEKLDLAVRAAASIMQGQ